MRRTTRHLEAAKRALAAGEDGAGLLALLDAWADVASTRIDALVTALSWRFPREELPTKVGEREQRWLAIAASADPRVVPTLLAGDWPVHPEAVKARFECLVTFRPDPRIARALRQLWEAGRYRSNAGGVFWRAAFRLLLNWNDPATSLLIKTARQNEDPACRIFASVVQKRTKRDLPEEPTLDAEILRLLDELDAIVGVEHGAPTRNDERLAKERLLAEVYAHPESDDARLVLADLWIQEGNPRGELVQLQHAIASGRAKLKAKERVKALLRAAGKTWLDGLGPTVGETQPRFHCGFVSEVTLTRPIDPTPAAWQTVHTLHLSMFGEGLADALLHPHLRTIRRISRVPMAELAKLASSGAPRSFEHVGVIAPLERLTPVATQAMRVENLAVSVARRDSWARIPFEEALEWFDTSGLRGVTNVLQLDVFEDSLAQAWAYFARTSSLTAIWLRPVMHDLLDGTPVAWDLRLSRDANGAPSVLEATWHAQLYRRSPMGLGAALQGLPPDALTSVTLRAAAKLDDGLRADFEDEITKAAKAQKHLTTFACFGIRE